MSWRAHWPTQATDSVAANAGGGRLGLNSLRTELPTEVRNLCMKVPRKRHGVSLLGSAANTQHFVHVGLGQPAETPTQTMVRVEKALVTLQSIERFACDQHDHVSFAKAWMLMSRGATAATTPGRRVETDAFSAPWKRCL